MVLGWYIVVTCLRKSEDRCQFNTSPIRTSQNKEEHCQNYKIDKMTTDPKNDNKLSILQYSPLNHCFASSESNLPEDQKPSLNWQHEYHEWFQQSCTGKNQPIFESVDEIRSFNNKGEELAKRLQEELPKVQVEPYKPIYDQICVKAYGWWHVRDDMYGFPICIQHLPVSDKLKADFSWWRHRKDGNLCMDDKVRQELFREGEQLEQRLHEELHQGGSVTNYPSTPKSTEM
jgi:hypothetical protein